MKTRFPPPCFSKERCAEALKMEQLGYSMTAIANTFGVSRSRLIVTLHNAKEFGFAYFAYHGVLLDYMDVLRSLGAKRENCRIYKYFVLHTGVEMPRQTFSASLAKIRPYL